jgi:hypothetical protein
MSIPCRAERRRGARRTRLDVLFWLVAIPYGVLSALAGQALGALLVVGLSWVAFRCPWTCSPSRPTASKPLHQGHPCAHRPPGRHELAVFRSTRSTLTVPQLFRYAALNPPDLRTH